MSGVLILKADTGSTPVSSIYNSGFVQGGIAKEEGSRVLLILPIYLIPRALAKAIYKPVCLIIKYLSKNRPEPRSIFLSTYTKGNRWEGFRFPWSVGAMFTTTRLGVDSQGF